MPTLEPTPDLQLSSARGRLVLTATVLGSGVAMLDASVVNVALPTIGRQLDAPLSGLQWTVTAYTLTLAAFILLGGSLGDRYGRRRLFVVGTVWFAVGSLACGIAPSLALLVVARAVQGIGGALLTPGSLAIIQSSFAPGDRARAIGAWSGLSGVATALGPLVGGLLVEHLGWRWVFFVNLPLAAVVVLLARRHVPETRDPDPPRTFDWAGAALAALALGGTTYALVQGPSSGAGGSAVVVVAAALVGVASAVAFVVVERRRREPMLPVGLFGSRTFTGANLVTFVVYAALSGVQFVLVLELQQVAGFSPLAAGASLLPVTVLLMLLSSRAGALAQRIGPRWPMTVGPVVAGAGVALFVRVGPGASYLADVLPGASVFGLGLALTVAPLTAAVLAAAPDRFAGSASGINNAVARAAGLLAVAVLPVAVGLSGEEYRDPAVLDRASGHALLIGAGLLVLGGLVAAVTVPGRDALGRPGRERERGQDAPSTAS